MLLQDKVAIITGGARGIGREIARTFTQEGACIVICDVDRSSLEEAEREISSLGGQAPLEIPNSTGKTKFLTGQVLTFQVDVTNSVQVEEMVNKVLDKFQKIDILINNAGITRDNLLLRMKEEEWDAVLNVNLKGTFLCTKAVSRAMVKQRAGKIVNIASIIGIMGNAGQANYAASKAGIIGFTKSIAKELASRNINVNAIAPGFIQTDMTAKLSEEVKSQMLASIPLNKFGQPSDVARVALFLVTEASNYITGQVIQVDGGMAM